MTNKKLVKFLWKEWNEECNCPWCLAKNKKIKTLLKDLVKNKVPLAAETQQWFLGLTKNLDLAFRLQVMRWRGVDRNLHKMFHLMTGKKIRFADKDFSFSK